MKKSASTGILVSCLLFLPSCGQEKMESQELAVIQKDQKNRTISLKGRDLQGKECNLEIEKKPDGSFQGLKFAAAFKVDYKIPAPGSGLYGVYEWQATFDTNVNYSNNAYTLRPSILRDADVIEGKGKPLFWDVDPLNHKLVIKPSWKSPKSVTYQSTSRIGGVIPFVVIDSECTL